MAVQTAAGSKIYISNAVSDSDTLSEFEAETYVEIGEVVSIGEFGSEFSAITFTALGDRLVRKFKGSEDPGTIALELGRDISDTGQAAVFTALGSDDDYAIKVTLNDQITPSTGNPTTFYFRAKVMSYRTNIGNVDQVVGATCSLGITTRPIEDAAT
jgi:hypothetical protein